MVSNSKFSASTCSKHDSMSTLTSVATRPISLQKEPPEQTLSASRRSLTVDEDTQKNSWVLVDATVFAAFAGLAEDIWTRLVGSFLHHSSGGAARIESVKLTSSANTSSLKLALTSTASKGWRGAVTRTLALSEFRNQNVTGLLIPLPVVRQLMSQERFPPNLALRESQLSHGQTLSLDQLLATARSYLQQSQIGPPHDSPGSATHA